MRHLEADSLESLPLPVVEQIDLLCERFESDWISGHPRALEEYLAVAPAGGHTLLLEELIGLEVEYRRKSGVQPSCEEYAQRLPNDADCIRRWWPNLFKADQQSQGLAIPSTAGRYELHEEIARGGMGVVFRASDPDLCRDLAVKVLLASHQNRPAMVDRFIEEGQISGQLQHPGIPAVHEVGRFPDGRPFIAMKLVKGSTLAALLAARSNPREEISRLLGVFEQLCQALAFVHSRRVIHRDLKPSNIMVGAFGEVQVMDWGLAKVLSAAHAEQKSPIDLDCTPTPACREPSTIRSLRSGASDQPDSDHQLTLDGSVIGTPAYMPPEQALGEVGRLDERCDVFALGAILCAILTGQPPYVGEDSAQVQRQAQSGDLGDAWERLDCCGADADLVGITKRCLAADPLDRPKDGSELASEVQAYISGIQDRLHRADLAALEVRTRAAQERKTRVVVLTLATAVVLSLLLGGGGWVWLLQGRQQRTSKTNQRVQEAFTEAIRLREQARLAPVDNLGRWLAAREMAQRAGTWAESGLVEPALSAQVHELIEELDDEVKIRQLIAHLDEVRFRRAEMGSQKHSYLGPAAADFADAFRSWGIGIGSKEARAAANRIRQRPDPIQGALVAAVEEWELVCTSAQADDKAWLQELIRVLQPEPWPTRVLAAAAREVPRSAFRLLGVAAAAKGRAEEALAAYRHVIFLHPGSAQVYFDLAGALTSLGFHNESIPVSRTALRLRPDFLAAHHQLAENLARLRNWDAALAAFRQVIVLEPNDVHAHHGMAIVQAEKGEWEAVVIQFARLLEMDPNNHEHRRWQIAATLQTGDEEAYRRRRDEMLERFGDDPDPLIAERTVTTCLLLPGNGDHLKRAESMADRALSNTPRWALPYAQYAKGLVEYRAGRLDSAEEWLRKSLEIATPGWNHPHLLLAIIAHRRGQLSEAGKRLAMADAIDKRLAKAVAISRDEVSEAIMMGVWVSQILRREAERWAKAPGDGSSQFKP